MSDQPQPARRLPPFPNGTSVVLLLMLAANYYVPFADLDYTWQIRTGAEVVHTGDLRPPDTFSYTIAGERPPDFEWLFEVVLWGTYEVFGYGGLKLLKTVLVWTPLLIVAWHLRRQGVRWHGVALVIAVAIPTLSTIWNLRALYCATICLLLTAAWLHDHCTGRRPLPWALLPVLWICGNIHPSVIMSQALILGAVAWEWLNQHVRLNRPLPSPALRRLTLVGLLAVAVSFVGPDPLDRFLYPFRPELRHPIMRIFAEMRPLYQIAADSWAAVCIVVVTYAVAAVTALTLVLRFRAYRLWEVALLVVLAVLANTAVRALQDWLLMMLMLSVPHLVQLLRGAAGRWRSDWKAALALRLDRVCKRAFNSPLLRFQPFWPLAGLAVLTVVSLTPPLCWNVEKQEAEDYPARAAAFIREKQLYGRYFTPLNYGAYLPWKAGERVKIYADTRGFFFPPQLLEDSIYLPQLRDDWRDRLDRVLNTYHTDYFFLETETEGDRGKLWELLKPHVRAPLYVDEQHEKVVLLSQEQVRAALRALDRP